MELYRIHGAAYDAFDTTGTALFDGRWHTRGVRLVYAAEHVSLAMLEVLVHAGGRKLPPKLLTRIRVQAGVRMEEAPSMELHQSQRFGDSWVMEKRSAVLRVPSVVVRGMEFNCLLNPAHHEFERVVKGETVEFGFDARLLAG